MKPLVISYTDGVFPELDPDLLVEETISRCALFRDQLAVVMGTLTPEETDLVTGADRMLISQAARLAPFWRQDLAEDREALAIPHESWWWWLDQIADGTYPRELLPELS